MNILPFAEMVQPFRGAAHDLKDDGNGALIPVEIGHGEGDALTLFIDAQNDELPRFRLAGNEGRIHFHQRHGRVEFPLFYNFVHNDILKTFSVITHIIIIDNAHLFKRFAAHL